MRRQHGKAFLLFFCRVCWCHSFGHAFSISPRTRRISVLYASSTSGGLYEVQEEMLVRQGILEEEWMKQTDRSVLISSVSSSLANKITKGSGGKGFGVGSAGSTSRTSSSSTKKHGRLQQVAKLYAQTLQSEGVVRIDNVLSNDLADAMLKYVMKLKDDAASTAPVDKPNSKVFADVLLRTNRCDLKLPLEEHDSPVMHALQYVLFESPVRATMEMALRGVDGGGIHMEDDTTAGGAFLHELSCLISSPGSQRQVVHPDTPMLSATVDHPSVLTCFMALQDITMDMGPTVFLPQTHTTVAHEQFHNDKETLLRTTPHAIAALPKGSCAVFDSRLLHCGSANRSRIPRALFYFSIRHSEISSPGNPASLRDELKGIPLAKLLEMITEGVYKKKARYH